MSNQEWTNQRNWQHWVHKTQDEEKQKAKSMRWTPLFTNKHKERK